MQQLTIKDLLRWQNEYIAYGKTRVLDMDSNVILEGQQEVKHSRFDPRHYSVCNDCFDDYMEFAGQYAMEDE